MMRPRPPTIKDVARVAGVSMKTVSRAMNGERGVGEDTARRVRDLAGQLGYSVNPAARSLSSGRTGSIGIVIYSSSQWQWTADLVAGALIQSRARGYGLAPYVLEHYEHDERETLLWLVAQHAVDGLILTTPWNENGRLHAELALRAMPFVLLPAPHDTPHLAVRCDDVGGARAVTEHLIGLGHRRIGLVGGQIELDQTRQRQSGYRAAMTAAGLAEGPTILQDYNFRTGYRAAKTMLQAADPPTAIFAMTDVLAAGVLRRAHELGVTAPGALSVAGMGDQAIAQLVWPALTTAAIPTLDMASMAVDLLLDEILQVPERRAERLFSTQVIARDSTGPWSPLT